MIRFIMVIMIMMKGRVEYKGQHRGVDDDNDKGGHQIIRGVWKVSITM